MSLLCAEQSVHWEAMSVQRLGSGTIKFDTLEETENHLFMLLERDPLCIHDLRGTKGVRPGNQSFDDRSYISFYV